ncbi:pilus (MSHA type) biogenesis protein MshL [Ningiella sp. W23]|uniref:pilus (MSHA type) biogenesis protein MshL n=1 Tax=Ningiella sp. W23 TaxID=3023715 RepID=UPI003757DF53
MNKQFLRFSVSGFACAFVLLGCSNTNKSHVEQHLANEIANISTDAPAKVTPSVVNADDTAALTRLPDSVSQTLLNPLQATAGTDLIAQEKYDINARSVDAASFFAGLVKDTPYSVAIHPEVDGSISLDLKQVSLDSIFSLVSDLYGYHVEKKGTIYRIMPTGMRTETFPVNYLIMQRNGNTQTSIISGGVAQNGGNNQQGGAFGNQGFNNFAGAGLQGSAGLGSQQGGNMMGGNVGNNGTMISTSIETNFWENLEESLRAMISDDGDSNRTVLVSPQAGLVTVRAYPDELKTIRKFLSSTEENLTRQVVIEARILEVELADEYQQGINWNQIVSNIGSTDLQFSTTAGILGNSISAALGGVTSLSFNNEDFGGVVDLLSTQGDVQVLSSPRVTAINNQKAVIKVGDDEYFVTDISSQNTITANATSVVPDIELTPFFSGIALDVTPQIDQNGSILLHIHPSVIETEEQEKVVTLNEERIVLPLAQSTIRESDTIIKAQSGEVVVIGGLMQTIKSTEVSKTPLLGDIPGLGNLFKNKRDREIKKELIILLKPTVVGEGTWQNQLEQSRSTMADWLYVE